MHRKRYPIKVFVINNGHPNSVNSIPKDRDIEIIQAGENLGWEGGLKLGLSKSDSDYVMFANDDIFIPYSSGEWIHKMMSVFSVEKVAAIGPTSNCVMGPQNIWADLPYPIYKVPYLIGFCMLLRRNALDKVGGVTQDLPGGDDLDLSIRLTNSGYELALVRDVFVFHHGFKTGTRVRGGADQEGGWNSRKMQEDTNQYLIRKHGLRKWHETLRGQPILAGYGDGVDYAGQKIVEVAKTGSTLELGCGGRKTLPNSVGVDFYGNGEFIPTIGVKSVADVKCSVENLREGFDKDSRLHRKFDNIIARHILEHLIDPVKALLHWRDYLADDGKLILELPNERLAQTIPMNPEHVHAYTESSIASLLLALGFKDVVVHDIGNGVSLVAEAVNPIRSCVSSTIQKYGVGVSLP